MAEISEEIPNVLREWAPFTDLLNKIPIRTQSGFFNQDICLTCVDILTEYIAVGTNVGVIYWYNRVKKDLQRLRCENTNSCIAQIKVISTVDFMVACGNTEGQITVFQIPKTHPDRIPDNLKQKTLKQVERYTVSDLHSGAITSLEWSKNGMKLFSGDRNGVVVLTEIDFYMHLSKSVDILNEAYEVVQLSYCQQYLLVSTTYRTIICRKEEKWKVCQVGKKDRKVLGKLGAVFWRNSYRPKDLSVYCSRPGLRIWISDLEGTVQQTLLFKDLLNKECFVVPLINPINSQTRKLKPFQEASFGILLPFGEHYLVTYSPDVIYVLDPINLLVIATINHLRRILSVSTHKNEIFVLEGERSLIRIAFKPEQIIPDASHPIASPFLPITNSFKDLTNKIQTSSIISALPPLFENTTNVDVHTDSTAIVKAEEAQESPNKWREFEKIGSEEYDEHILFKHRRRKRAMKLDTSVTSLSSNSSEERDGFGTTTTHACVLDLSTIGLMPDLRSPDSILHDIENKEKMLADLLHLDNVTLSKFENEIDFSFNNQTESKINEKKLVKSDFVEDMNNSHYFPISNGIGKKIEIKCPVTTISYGPPSGSSNPTSIDPPACFTVPSLWKLQEITLAQPDTTNDSDSSLCDWEIV